jgi:hypothetical protein
MINWKVVMTQFEVLALHFPRQTEETAGVLSQDS